MHMCVSLLHCPYLPGAGGAEETYVRHCSLVYHLHTTSNSLLSKLTHEELYLVHSQEFRVQLIT